MKGLLIEPDALGDEAQGVAYTEDEVRQMAALRGMRLDRGEDGYRLWSTRSHCVVAGSSYDLTLSDAAAVVIGASLFA